MSYNPLAYWNDRAQSWINETFETEQNWELIREFIKPEWSVLELGSGTGRFAPYFADYTGWDIAQSLVDFAQAQYPDKLFIQREITGTIPRYDLIFSFSGLQHVPEAVLKEVVMPETNLLFVEPHTPSGVEHCFRHDYEGLFGVKPLKTSGIITVFGRLV